MPAHGPFFGRRPPGPDAASLAPRGRRVNPPDPADDGGRQGAAAAAVRSVLQRLQRLGAVAVELTTRRRSVAVLEDVDERSLEPAALLAGRLLGPGDDDGVA